MQKLSVEEAIVRLLEGSLSSEEHGMLMDELADRPDLADRVIRAVTVDDLIQRHVGEAQQLAHENWIADFLAGGHAETADFTDDTLSSAFVDRDVVAHEPLKPASPALRQRSVDRPRNLPDIAARSRPMTRRFKVSAIALASVGLLVVVLLAQQFSRNTARPDSTEPPRNVSPQQIASEKVERSRHSESMPSPQRLIENSGVQELAVIEALSNGAGDEHYIGKQFTAEENLILSKGNVTLRFPAGVLAIVSGPAELKFVSPMKAILRSGRFTASVEPLAKGFTVVTPHADVVDQGTRFGINVDTSGASDVLVFDGIVDVHYSGARGDPERKTRRLVVGEALCIKTQGDVHPVTVIEKGTGPADWSATITDATGPIAKLADNFVGPGQPFCYAIVKKGLDEDALAYVDRPYEWNSFPGEEFPKVLRGADYIQTINSLKWIVNLQIHLELRLDADIYVLFDERVRVPAWLKHGFERTDMRIGMDEFRPWANPSIYAPVGPKLESARTLGKGAGNSVDLHFRLWKKRELAGRDITFGSLMEAPPNLTNLDEMDEMSMYGIAVVPVAR